MKKALFLDRDGVINIDKQYVYKKEDFVFCERIFDGLNIYQDLGYLLFIITNQSGIGRGYYSKEDFLALTSFVKKEFLKRNITIQKVYYCPHSPEAKCDCRKPKPFMILRAKGEFGIDLKKSIVIGDKISDMEAGRNAGVKNLFLLGGDKGSFYKNAKSVYDTIGLLKEK